MANCKLNQNYPNPFKQSTMINYQLPKTGMVSLKVYNITGQLVRTLVNTRMTAGSYSYNWDGKDDRKKAIGNGIYFYQLQVDGTVTKTNKMIKLR
ncbi:MAG: T9SS type A sorting domain-containing protein [Desulfocucumaceae bacterium]